MTPTHAPEALDDVLAVQLLIAWAGESPAGGAARLRWWKTDLIDPDGGGDLWQRLLPRTHLWAGLDAARRAARLTDDGIRRTAGRADEMVTLFHFGFELDEALDERLAHHKLEARAPAEALPLLRALATPFDAGSLLSSLGGKDLDGRYKIVPGGRQLKRVPEDDVARQARRLACAMLTDPPAAYPLPFILTEAPRGER